MTSSPRLLLAIGLALTLAACGDDPAEVGLGAACGGRTSATCGPDLYCDFPGNTCGAADEPGRCMPRPASCPTLFVPELTCGCDRRVYPSACDAALAGTDLNQGAACPLGRGSFACGYRQCSLVNQYCRRDPSDVAGTPDGFSCPGLPSCPGGASCACLAGDPCGARCEGDAAAGLTLTCPGG